MANVSSEQLQGWADTIDRAGTTASNAHGRQLAAVAEEIREAAGGKPVAQPPAPQSPATPGQQA